MGGITTYVFIHHRLWIVVYLKTTKDLSRAFTGATPNAPASKELHILGEDRELHLDHTEQQPAIC